MAVFFFINDKFECCDDSLRNKPSRAILQMIFEYIGTKINHPSQGSMIGKDYRQSFEIGKSV